ncbi:MAG: GDP-mannose 4,6-dehydratase [Planctomycetaceae bacterium]|nr:GDP-mannose 4,6-dehydratase [Planctomycetaceae bacterium]
MSRTALILGVSGQDGAYLAQHLLREGYAVHGTSRDATVNSFANLTRLGIREEVTLHSVTLTDFRSALQTLTRIAPDEVYNLAGQSSVGLSFAQPVETLDSIARGTLNLLETIRFTGAPIRFYNACSTECFGDTGDSIANELSPFRPRSPYAVAKATSFWEVANYRESYDLFACSGILSNHDSPLRPERFVTQKIVASACRIAAGRQQELTLGNLDISRDWGWAPDYVVAMHSMLQQPTADDYVVATGQSHTLEEFVAAAFEAVNLTWRDYVRIDPDLFRPSDIARCQVSAEKAERVLGWHAQHHMPQVVELMVEAWLEQHPEDRCASR